MATPAHCLYCFECLTAALDRRKTPSLAEAEDLWEEYQHALSSSSKESRDDLQMTDAEEDGDEQEQEQEEIDDQDVLVTGTGRRIPLRDHSDPAERNNPRENRSLAPPSLLRRTLPSPSSASSSSTPSLQSKSSGTSSTAIQRSLASSRTSLSASDTPDTYSAAVRSGNARAPDSPMFVTWNIASRSGGGSKNLRGCIGTFEKQNLEDGLRTYALTSAFEDTRFTPISASEVPRLSVSVTLLTDFERCANPMDWDLGTHGLRIAFTYHGKRYGATYLPDVPKEQGWSKAETLVSLMRKAGWNGRREEWSRVLEGGGEERIGGTMRNGGMSGFRWSGKREEQAEVVRYRGSKVGLSWEEWDGWREWAEEGGLL